LFTTACDVQVRLCHVQSSECALLTIYRYSPLVKHYYPSSALHFKRHVPGTILSTRHLPAKAPLPPELRQQALSAAANTRTQARRHQADDRTRKSALRRPSSTHYQAFTRRTRRETKHHANVLHHQTPGPRFPNRRLQGPGPLGMARRTAQRTACAEVRAGRVFPGLEGRV
jgi:hypothetical protein